MAENQAEKQALREPCWYVVHTYSGYENKVKDNIEKTIDTISTMGREGMKQTDEEILSLMLKD